MAVAGVWDEKEIKLLLKKLLDNKDEVFKFAVAASGPKEGQLVLDKKQKLKKKDVQDEAEAEAKKNGGKAVKLDLMTGECRLDAKNEATLRLIVYGKAPAKAVACMEHLLTKGPFKTVGFKNVILEEVAEESADVPAATGGGAAPGAPPDEQTKWEQALADIEPAYLQGLRDRPDDANKLRAVLGFAQSKAEAMDYKAAIAALQKLAEALRGKPAAATSEEKTSPPSTAGSTAPDPAALFNERLKALLPDIKSAAGTPAGDAAKLKASEAGVFARKRDFEHAQRLLDEVESLLRPAVGSPPVADEAKTPPQTAPRGAVAYAKLLLDWRAAQQRVAANIVEFGRAVPAREDVQADPRLARVREAVAAMPELVPAFGEELNDLIDAAMNAGAGPNAAPLLDKARDVVTRYRAQLAAAATLARLEKFAAKHSGDGSDVYSALDTTLSALEREFAARNA